LKDNVNTKISLRVMKWHLSNAIARVILLHSVFNAETGDSVN